MLLDSHNRFHQSLITHILRVVFRLKVIFDVEFPELFAEIKLIFLYLVSVLLLLGFIDKSESLE